MFWWEILFAFGVAVLITLIFAAGFRRTGPWSGFWAFFFIILLAAWAGGLWVEPFGPEFYGVYWFPFIVVGLIFAFLLAAVTPPRDIEPKTSEEKLREDKREEAAAKGVLGIFFWLILTILIIAIIAGYLTPETQQL